MTEEEMLEEEKYIIGRIEMIQEDYRRAAKPYVDRLMQIRAVYQPKVSMDIDQAVSLGLLPSCCQNGKGERKD